MDNLISAVKEKLLSFR